MAVMDDLACTLSPRGATLARKYASSSLTLLADILAHPYCKERPDGYVNLGVAENYAMLDRYAKFLDERLSVVAPDLTYGEGPNGTSRLSNAMAKHIERFILGRGGSGIETDTSPTPKVDPKKIIFGNGVTSLVDILAYCLASEGEGILLPRPIYQAFQEDMELKSNVNAVFVDFDCFEEGDQQHRTSPVNPGISLLMKQFDPTFAVECYEKAILKAQTQGTQIRAMIFTNPHNPLGRCYPRETILALLNLCAKYKIHFISDEVYALSQYDKNHGNPASAQFISALDVHADSQLPLSHIHHLYGFSKDFGGGGLRLGCIYSPGNTALLNSISAISRFSWPSSLSMKAASLLLEDEAFIKSVMKESAQKLSRARDVIDEVLSPYSIPIADGRADGSGGAGFFLWLDLRRYLVDEKDLESYVGSLSNYNPRHNHPERYILKHLVSNKVFLTPGKSLGSVEAGWFRLVFSHDEEVLRVGLNRLTKTLDTLQGEIDARAKVKAEDTKANVLDLDLDLQHQKQTSLPIHHRSRDSGYEM